MIQPNMMMCNAMCIRVYTTNSLRWMRSTFASRTTPLRQMAAVGKFE